MPSKLSATCLPIWRRKVDPHERDGTVLCTGGRIAVQPKLEEWRHARRAEARGESSSADRQHEVIEQGEDMQEGTMVAVSLS